MTMLVALPMVPMLAIYVLAAVLPAVVLLCYVYRHDTIEKEPPLLLCFLLLMGVAAALGSAVLEGGADAILKIVIEPGSLLYTIFLAFFGVALIEEGLKMFLLKRCTWRHHAFNYRFDGIVYAVFVSLGFAAYENIQYVLHYGLSVALLRALLAVPGHMAFAVCMGFFYGRAKLCDNRGENIAAKRNLRIGYVCAILLHGFYDACAMIGTLASMILFAVFVLLMFSGIYRLLMRESKKDVAIEPMDC